MGTLLDIAGSKPLMIEKCHDVHHLRRLQVGAVAVPPLDGASVQCSGIASAARILKTNETKALQYY